MRFTLSPEAQRDLDDIWLHIARDDIEAADGVIDYLGQSCRRIAASPNIGRLREDLWPGAYCHNTGKAGWRSHFLIFYWERSTGIEIARILEGHRNITPEFFE